MLSSYLYLVDSFPYGAYDKLKNRLAYETSFPS
jgi:hypothetical protein